MISPSYFEGCSNMETLKLVIILALKLTIVHAEEATGIDTIQVHNDADEKDKCNTEETHCHLSICELLMIGHSQLCFVI